MLDAKLPFLPFCKFSLCLPCVQVFLLSLFKESKLLSMKLKDVQVVDIHHHINSVYWPWKNILLCNQVLCAVAHAGFCFWTKSVCVWLMTSVCTVCTVAPPGSALGESHHSLKIFHHNETRFGLICSFFVFYFGRSVQIFIAFVQVPSVPLTILAHKRVGTSVVTVKLKSNTKSIRVTHTGNMMYTSIQNSLRENWYLGKVKCSKFSFCIIILKFRICVCM